MIFDIFRSKKSLESNASPITTRALSEAEIKEKTSILFIDDNEFRVVDILINNGWRNTRLIEDVGSLDDQLVRSAHILFIDIHGIGKAMEFSNEGLGLTSALKRKYPEKKIVIYSSEKEGDRFDEGFEDADYRIWKNADPIRFISLVEDCSKEIFSLEGCAKRLQEAINSEFNINMSEDDIKEKIIAVSKSSDRSELAISRIFNLNNVSNIASIIGLYLSVSS